MTLLQSPPSFLLSKPLLYHLLLLPPLPWFLHSSTQPNLVPFTLSAPPPFLLSSFRPSPTRHPHLSRENYVKVCNALFCQQLAMGVGPAPNYQAALRFGVCNGTPKRCTDSAASPYNKVKLEQWSCSTFALFTTLICKPP